MNQAPRNRLSNDVRFKEATERIVELLSMTEKQIAAGLDWEASAPTEQALQSNVGREQLMVEQETRLELQAALAMISHSRDRLIRLVEGESA